MHTVLRRLSWVAASLLILLGGAATWASAEQSAGGGWFGTPRAEFRTPTRALVTDEIEVSTGQTGDPAMDIGELAALRIRADRPGASGRAPLFLGIARRADADRYLRGVAHDRLDRVHQNPFRAEFTRSAGTRRPDRPADQDIWVATGSDRRPLTWNKTGGTWTLVVMNADAAPRLAVGADLGLRFGFLPWTAAILLGSGLSALTVLIVRARRRA
jgi:hypothetical protein